MRKPFDQDYPLEQGFGEHPELYAKFGINGHNGLDYGLPPRTPVLAPHGGTIIEATFDEAGYGNYVKIENDNEGSTLAHLDEIDVRVGFQVSEGDLIGYSGSTGNSTGPHLHWGYFSKPRNRSNGFDGYINQLSLIQTSPLPTRYVIGDTIETILNVPVGSKRGNETFDYGKIGPKFPAKVTGIYNGYYNIDQTAIGGGTGWVKAETIDVIAPYVPVTNSKENPVMFTQDQFDSVLKERDAALTTSQEATAKYNDIYTTYSGFVALGFQKPEDVTKLLTEKDDKFIGLGKQLTQVLKRNSDLAKMVQDKENEDSTAIDEGIKMIYENKKLKDTVTEISKTVGSSNNLFDILETIKHLQEYVKRIFEGKKAQAAEVAAKTPQKKGRRKAKETPVTVLLDTLGLGGDSK